MPTYNRAKWISLGIECFLQQTFTDSELVILDNGNDNTETLIPEHPRIRYHRQPGPRLTTGEMRNLCNQLAAGDVLVHWDDDDWSAPERIESQLRQMDESGKPLVGYHNISYWDASPSTLTPERRAYQYRGVRPYACGTSMCYLRELWQQHPFPAKQQGEDSDFSLEAKCAGLLESYDGTQMIVARAHLDD